jgi:hypothetical protein
MEFREQVSQVHNAKLSVNDLVIKAALALRAPTPTPPSATRPSFNMRASTSAWPWRRTMG